MSGTLDLTILYEDGEEGWIVASIPAVPGVLGQGRSREEAREIVLDALALMLSAEPGEERERELLLDEGGNHTRWVSQAGPRSAVPRHSEIDWKLVRAICKQPESHRPRAIGRATSSLLAQICSRKFS